MENLKKTAFLKGSIQEYIYLSYLYLLIVGTLSYSIYYAFLGINIIKYSTLFDILLSPIVILTENIKIPLFMGSYILLILIFIWWSQKRIKKNLKKEVTKEKELNLKKRYASLQYIKFLIIIIGTLGFYIGYALGGGYKINNKIKNGDFKVNKLIEFTDGNMQKVKLIELNSLYVFYVLENEKKVSISPISGNIKTIHNLE
ncbi:hypothetical protein SAMN04487910_4236 [Aquimarina amphilecti]|uniref:Uncharacterized protein n=1 Tax=Aquimarina amphilecti TaxID=1038014 RepID=A0A1H7VW62_AQUAM|nr:hypothetical protein [Aquimarina amphilecti]SEM13523.1 hypothetical protein SAMN04487910_4236 [Aquimarina amphilecti]